MNRTVFLVLALALLATKLFARAADSLRFGRFGKVMLYRQSPIPSHVVLFVSGDGGWNWGVVDIARKLASLNGLVVGIDIIHYLKQIEGDDQVCTARLSGVSRAMLHERSEKYGIKTKAAVQHYDVSVLVRL